MQTPKINSGSKLKLKLLTVLPTDTQPTPTVDMEVKRVADDGLGLAFINRTAEHLWNSVQRLRSELEIGRDYFQVHQSVALTHPDKGVLMVQQNGKWLFPGFYLQVGQNALQAASSFVAEELGVADRTRLQPLVTDSATDVSVTEAATYSVILHGEITQPEITLNDSSGFKDWRWIGKIRDLGEITFAVNLQRNTVQQLLEAARQRGTEA